MKDVKDENAQAWAELLEGLKEARAHFSTSYRHVLLGVAEGLKVLQHAMRSNAESTVPPQANAAMDLLRRGLLLWADRVPDLLEAANLDLAKREALVTVKEVLTAELRRLDEAGENSEQNEVKRDALKALLRVIDTQLEKGSSDQTASESEPKLRRVTID